jgi:hypothetical protein
MEDFAQLLIAKSVAPVKKQYIVFRSGHGIADQGKAGDMLVAVAGAAGASPPAAAAVTTGGTAVEAKSRTRMKRVRGSASNLLEVHPGVVP